jgi:diguanylate cyclase (GGDEF)-like protein/PAS domain S-box-containing protein
MLTTPGSSTRLRARHRRRDGSWIWMEVTNNNRLEHSEGRVVTDMIDISDEMVALESLRQREQLLARLTEALPSGVLHIGRDRNVVYSNARLHHLVGIERSATIDEQLASVISDDRAALATALDNALIHGSDTDLEARLRVDGHAYVRRCSIVVKTLTDIDDKPVGAVLCIDDITDAFEMRAELERRATVDELTGCLNRAAVLDELERAMPHRLDGSSGTAAVFLDLDDFKEVNDTFGHKAGDQLLATTAARLRGAMRDRDIIGRLGGDEFLVVLPTISGIDEAMQIVRRLGDALVEPFEVDGGFPLRIRSSMGVAWSSSQAITAEGLVAAADRAMYTSKRIGLCEPVVVECEDSPAEIE